MFCRKKEKIKSKGGGFVNYIDKITLENLKEEQKEIAEIIGIENYIRLVKCFGGSSIYIHKADTISRVIRDEQIKIEFNGHNYKELALKYNLSTNQIREIVDKDILKNTQLSLL